MSFYRIATLASLTAVAVVATACGSTVDSQSGSTSSGTGGNATTSSTTSSTGGAGGAGGVSSTGGGGEGQPSAKYPAFHPPVPTVANYGGPVLASPKIVPVFFTNDDAPTVAALKDFTNQIGGTHYWTATTSEYGVGPADGSTSVDLMEAAPSAIDDSDIETWLAGKLENADPLWPAADENTVYVLYYPAGTSITLQGSQSCQTFGGYHANITLDAAHGSMDVAYAVVPRCANFAGMNTMDATTGSASHEMIEAATDPYPFTNPAYADVDDQDIYWSRALGGGETGDMCAQFAQSFTTFDELPYLVQRTWSNQQALAGHDPCQPELPGEVYFNAAPELDHIPISIFGQQVNVRGVTIPVGMSKTIDLDLFSDASTNGPFSIHADDLSSLYGGPQELTFKIDPSEVAPCPAMSPAGSVCAKGQNGQKIHLTITVVAASSHGSESFFVVARQGQVENLWIGLVGN
jgi:hypothetical protein